YRAKQLSERSAAKRSAGRRTERIKVNAEFVTGRNSVVEALRAGIPAKALHVAIRIDVDDRVRESLKLAAEHGIPLLEASKPELDRMTDDAIHQGLALQIPPYEYKDAVQLATKTIKDFDKGYTKTQP
ncbi:23S rRNA (guanosine(2251)-2'-O)-methyltransferase RlmB, partial [Escherichia coli]|nr:23S rRNA (guanosine(2251)-2'-O)-methyltransferase RlmB [Escherichia coli]